MAGPQRRRRLGTGDLRIRLISVCAPNKNQLKKQRPGALWHRGAILGAEKKDSDTDASESFLYSTDEFIQLGIDKTSDNPSRVHSKESGDQEPADALRFDAAEPLHPLRHCEASYGKAHRS